jgi:hypothetical protein
MQMGSGFAGTVRRDARQYNAARHEINALKEWGKYRIAREISRNTRPKNRR